ncbi:hypothetical protein ACW5WK_02740 [Aeromonas enteropelogenes]|uniref:hypothetical protein n=1 Tax=Aeromonas enteropelogenes TaxID=29489 RepID=UPI0005AAA198|nr:hypothetical protein [Aeromonas enteropelogenes]UBH56293.1 hypothetical protein LA341_20870 [Aeromonas enteropelogenes]
MSLLAALAKGVGAGTVDNARTGFAEQQRQREAAQRRDDMQVELDARDKLAQKQIDASRAENDTRFKAMAGENQKNRDHDWAMFEKRLALETQAAAANASVRAREMHAKNIMGTMDQLTKRKAELMENDKIGEEQRAVALGEIDALGYTLASDPGAQQLLNEFGGGGYANYWLSLAPQKSQDPPPQEPSQPTPTQPPKPQGIIPRLQGDRSIEKALIQSGREALTANKNPDAMAASAYQKMYQ